MVSAATCLHPRVMLLAAAAPDGTLRVSWGCHFFSHFEATQGIATTPCLTQLVWCSPKMLQQKLQNLVLLGKTKPIGLVTRAAHGCLNHASSIQAPTPADLA